MRTGHIRGLTRGATDGALLYSSCRKPEPTRTRTQRRKGRKISQKNICKQLQLYLFFWWHGGYARSSTVVTKCINWPLGRRHGKRLPWETLLPLAKVKASDLPRVKMWNISRRLRGHRGGDCRSSLHGAVSVVTLPRVLLGGIKGLFLNAASVQSQTPLRLT